MTSPSVIAMAGVCGSMVGSFLNVVIHRLPRPGMSVINPPRSICPSCGAAIAWFDNIPLISYFVLRGRCRHCKAPVSVRYLLVEAATAALFVLLVVLKTPPGGASGASTDWALLAVYLWVVSAAVAITGIDWDIKIIPDQITLPLALLLPLLCFALPDSQICATGWSFRQFAAGGLGPGLSAYAASVCGELVGILFLWSLVWIFSWLLGRPAMGLGDVKYMAVIGGLLGPERALAGFGLACVAGAVLGLPFRLITGEREIPFGPFLSFGLVLMVLVADPVVDFLLHWPRYLLGS